MRLPWWLRRLVCEHETTELRLGWPIERCGGCGRVLGEEVCVRCRKDVTPEACPGCEERRAA